MDGGGPSRAISVRPSVISSTPAITASTTHNQTGSGPSFWVAGLSLMLHRLVAPFVGGST